MTSRTRIQISPCTMDVVIVIGGMGSFGETLLAPIMCGLLQSVITVISAPMANIVIFIFLAVVLVVKPGGFFGQVTRYAGGGH